MSPEPRITHSAVQTIRRSDLGISTESESKSSSFDLLPDTGHGAYGALRIRMQVEKRPPSSAPPNEAPNGYTKRNSATALAWHVSRTYRRVIGTSRSLLFSRRARACVWVPQPCLDCLGVRQRNPKRSWALAQTGHRRSTPHGSPRARCPPSRSSRRAPTSTCRDRPQQEPISIHLLVQHLVPAYRCPTCGRCAVTVPSERFGSIYDEIVTAAHHRCVWRQGRIQIAVDV